MSIFRGFQGGEIQPATTGLLESSARSNELMFKAITGAGEALAQGIKEYSKNAQAREQAIADASSSGLELGRMMSFLDQTPEFKGFTEPYKKLIEKAQGAPNMSTAQVLALGNEIKVARQNLGTDFQFYQMGQQRMLEGIARKGMNVVTQEVPIGYEGVNFDINLRVDEKQGNIYSQLEAHRQKYNQLTKGLANVKPFDEVLLERAGNIETSIAGMANAPEDLKANALNAFRGYIDSRKRASDVIGSKMGYNYGDFTGENTSVIQFRTAQEELTKAMQGDMNRAGMPTLDMTGYADIGAGIPKPPDGYMEGVSPMVRDAMIASAPIYAAEAGRASPLEAARAGRAIDEGRAKKVEEARVANARTQLSSLEQKAKAINTELESLRKQDVRTTKPQLIRTFSPDAGGFVYQPTNVYLSDAEIVKSEQELASKVKQKEKELDDVNKSIKSAQEGIVPKTEPTAEQKAAAPALPTFGAANIEVGKKIVMGQMAMQQKRDTLRRFVANQVGWDSSTIDNVVNSMLPSSGPDLHILDTPAGKLAFLGQPDGKYVQVNLSGGEGKSYLNFGTMTPSGAWIPKVIKSADGKTQISIAGQFQGPDSAFVKWQDAIVDYVSGVSAAKELGEIIGITGKSMPWNKDIRARAENLVSRIRAASRLDVIGPGAVSEYEHQMLENIISNPTDVMSLDSANRARVQAIIEKLENHIVERGQVVGLNVRVDNKQSNSQIESDLRKQVSR